MAQSYVRVPNLTAVAGMEGWSVDPEHPNEASPNIYVVFEPERVREFWSDNRFDDLVEWLDSESVVKLEHIDYHVGHLWVKMY